MTVERVQDAVPGSIREIAVYGVDGTYKSVVRADTAAGLSIDIDPTGRVVVNDGGLFAAMFGHFFSMRASRKPL